MANPLGDGNESWAAVALAALLTGVGTLYRMWFAVRRDGREDSKASTIHGTYEEVIDSLREELQRVRNEIDVEREKRRAAEARAEELERRINALQDRCDDLERGSR